MKRLRSKLSILLILTVLMSSLSGFASAAGSNTDVEIQKAIDLGFVPEELQNSYDSQISYAEFCSILDSFISAMSPDALSDWQSISGNYRNADDRMSRMEGALVLLYAAQCAGFDAVGYEYTINLEELAGNYNVFFEGVTWDYPLLPDPTEIYYNEVIANSERRAWRCELGYDDNAIIFVSYLSYGNGKTYFDYDERYSLNLGKAFTRGDAIRAVARLYENARFAHYILAGQASCTVSDSAISLGEAMPEASWQQLPDWTGYTVTSRKSTVHSARGMLYQKEEIDVLRSLGFNFVRVPLDSRMIFDGTDMSRVNPAFLESMDDLIEYCAEAGIHVCFDLHDMPGFNTGGDERDITLWEDRDIQILFVEFWRFLAEYYKDVPSNVLSFNLLNEPHGVDDAPTDAVYSKLMLEAIEAIREATPDRLIFVDTLGVIRGVPVQGLADAQIVQTIHPYFLEREAKAAQAWPGYVINGFIRRNDGALTFKGDFPAGTVVTVELSAVGIDSMFTIEADGKSILTTPVGKSENGCLNMNMENTGDKLPRYEYDSAVMTAELDKECSEIKLVQDEGWYLLGNLSIETKDYSVHIHADENYVEDETVPVLSIDGSGAVSSNKAGTLVLQSREWLEDIFRSYQAFTEETGTRIMVQEFGFHGTIDYEAALAAADDFLSVLDAYDIPWCSWDGDFGPVEDIRENEWESVVEGLSPVLREGAEYEMVSEHWMVDTGLMEVYHRYMTGHGEEPVQISSIAYASTQTVSIDGKPVTLEAYALKDANGNPTNYVKLRDVAYVLNGTAAQFEVGWDGNVNIVTGQSYTANGSEMSTPFSGDRAYTIPTAQTNINGAAADLAAISLTDDSGGGYTYYQLRDLGRALGFNVGWSAERGIFIETDKPYTDAD